MKRACLLLLTACGPTVPIGEGDDANGDDDSGTTTSTGSATASDTYSTSPTTADPTFHTTPVVDSSEVDVDDGEITEDDDDGNDDDAWIVPPDGSGCFTSCVECDVWAQDCMDGQKCMPWANDGGNAWNATRCSQVVDEAGGVGDPCTVEGSGVSGIDTCMLGAMCFGVDSLTNEGVCVGICGGSPANPECPEGLACMQGFEGEVNLCLPACDPLAPTCAVDEVCAHSTMVDPEDGPFVCQPVPPLEPQPYGAACEGGLAICDAGLACVWAERIPSCVGQRCCTLLGNAAVPPECPEMGQTCVPFEDGATEGPCYCGIP
jgi:hypothetical protein